MTSKNQNNQINYNIDIQEEIPENIPSPYNGYIDDHSHYESKAQNSKQSQITKNYNKRFINPFDSVQNSNNYGFGQSTSTNNLLVRRSTKKFNFNASSTNNNDNNIHPKNTKHATYITDNNIILEDDLNFNINDDDTFDKDNKELITKFSNLNCDVFTSESNFKISQEIHSKQNESKNIDIDIANILQYTFQYPVPHCKLSLYETNKKLESVINNSLYDEIPFNELKSFKHKPQYKWNKLPQNDINEHIDKIFYDNLTSMKLFEEKNKLLHKTMISIKDLYNSYISDLIKYDYKCNLTNEMFTHYRKIPSDDDYSGLFRILLFAYMENCICFNRKESLSILLYNYIIHLQQNEEYISNIIIVKILLEHLNQNQLDLAYQVLLNIFIHATLFVNSIVNYIGHIFKYVFLNYKLNSNFFKELLRKMKKENNIEYISQSTICLIYIFGVLFETSIHIYQPFINESKIYSITHIKTHMIYLIFDYPLLYIGYPSLLVSLTSYSQKILFPNSNDFPFINADNKKCYICNKFTSHIILYEITNPICKQCLSNSIQHIIKKKTSLLCKNQYSFPMFYCGRIFLHRELFLLNETSIMFNNDISIQTSIRMIITSQHMCVYCKKNFTIFIKCFCLYPCGCLYCKDCIIKKITAFTNEKLLLNNYEFITEKFTFKCSGCKNEISNIDEYLLLMESVFEEKRMIVLKQDAWKRLKMAMERNCCYCGNESIDYEMMFYEKKHKLCCKCKERLDKKALKGTIRMDCLFCGKELHEYNSLIAKAIKEERKGVQMENENNVSRSKNKSDNNCCVIG